MALIAAVFVASLIGSAHCAAMCGGFACLASAAPSRRASWRDAGAASAAYHTGRLVSYVGLGAVAGLVGQGLEHAGSLAGVQRTAAIAASVLLILWGLTQLAEQQGMRVPWPSPLRGVQQWLGGRLAALQQHPPAVRGAALGLLTTLLPCGWLYAFVVTAAGTGAPLPAMITMAVFWLGTVPALVAVGVGARTLTGPLRTRLPQLTALALVAVGVFSLARRAPMAVPHPHGDAIHGNAIHGH